MRKEKKERKKKKKKKKVEPLMCSLVESCRTMRMSEGLRQIREIFEKFVWYLEDKED